MISFLCHHTENFYLRHLVLEVCCTIAICVDRNRIFANRLHVTIAYTFDLAVRNVERLNVSRFVRGCMFLSKPVFGVSDQVRYIPGCAVTGDG